MHIFDIAPFGVYPPKSGGHRRVHNLNLESSKRGNEIFLFSQGIRSFELRFPLKSGITRINDNYSEYRYVNVISLTTSLFGDKLLGVPPIFTGDVLKFSKPRIVKNQIEKSEIIKIEHPWQFNYCYTINREYKRPTILVEHNAEFELIKHTMKSRLMPKIYQMALKREKYALENADFIFTTSNEDKRKLVNQFDIEETNMYIVPNGVDISQFFPCFRIEKEINKDILFLIVGRCGDAFKDIRKSNIVFTGYVEDTVPYLKVADIAINPMLSGSGTNIKVLEYLASGLPTITTPAGARGLEVVSNKDVIIAHAENFYDTLIDLLKDEEKQKELSENGRKLVEEKYNWELIGETEDRLLRKICNDIN
jgi:glycosyltransferase involved in cell wall biosynthesis